ncbi:hypothetical protein [Planctomicrobium piriforme]|nr:hypothetical protein [Planctomicrobium piriforme]
MVLLNGYYDRFKTIQAAEEDYKNRHPSSESQSYESGKPRAAGLPLRRGVKNSELVELKLRLETAFDRLVRRCVEEQMISPAAAQTMLREFHRSTDP